ncbi:MAG: hypothetical protein JJT96_07730 [Opitutales bacterium]|nr:hypothetical protein [Opitutales bacterium]
MNEATLLLRQIHPAFVQDGRITSQAFRPTPKDQCQLSVYDGDLIDGEKAWIHYTEELALQSVGVQAVSYTECTEMELSVHSDPATFPEHALIDFTGLGKKTIEKKAKHLRSKAEHRGWLFTANP